MISSKEQLSNLLRELIREDPKLREEILEIVRKDEYVRRDEMTQVLEEIKQLRIDMNKRFEAVDRRFEELISSMNKKFEAVDKRFEAVDRRFEELIKELKTIKVNVSSLGGRVGIGVEKTILEIMEEAILKEGLTKETVKKIEKFSLRDVEGKFWYPRFKIEFDGIISNGETILLEIKFKPSIADVEFFLKKVAAYEYYRKEKPRLWLIAIEISEKVLEHAEERGIKVIYSQLKTVPD